MTVAYKYMKNPVAVERINAHAGMDIGDTLVGMHLKDVAVHIVCAGTRPFSSMSLSCAVNTFCDTEPIVFLVLRNALCRP